LDIGGAHGHYAATLCRRYPRLGGIVLDLPEMIEHASPWLEAEGLGERLRHQAGDVLATDLGEDRFDLVFVAQLVHHFDAEQNRDLLRRIARALKPGGVVVVQDVFKPSSPDEAGQAGALGDFFFAMTSAAGTWRYRDVASWQAAAGLEPHRPLPLRSVPGTGQQAATRGA
jgi:predicted O-methyltransferase YrrM